MPTTTSITTTYAGEHAGDFISAALLSGNTLSQGGITVKPNIKFKQVVSKIATDDLLADATCDFTATSTITKTERILEPIAAQVNLQLCKEDFRSDWQAMEMGFSAFDNLPKTFQAFLIGHVAAKVAEKTEQNIWSGEAGVNSQYDGFEILLAEDANLPAANEVTGTTVTAANVVAELGKIVDAIPSSLYGKEDLHIYVSQNIYRAYVRSLGTLGFVDRFNNQNMGDVMFDGVKLFVANGLSDNTAICAEKSNLYFGTGLLNDSNEVKILDMAELDGSQNVRIVMRMTAAVQYGVVEDIVTYGIVNAVN